MDYEDASFQNPYINNVFQSRDKTEITSEAEEKICPFISRRTKFGLSFQEYVEKVQKEKVPKQDFIDKK